MPDQAPGIFGVDNLTKAVRTLETTLTKRLDALTHAVEALSRRLDGRLERIGSTIMATLDTLAGQVADLKGAAQAEAQEVKSKLDEMTALIEQLQQNTNDPAKVDQISQDLDSLKSEIQSIFTGEPVPSPQPSRRR